MLTMKKDETPSREEYRATKAVRSRGCLHHHERRENSISNWNQRRHINRVSYLTVKRL
jgi:hypothetical protein